MVDIVRVIVEVDWVDVLIFFGWIFCIGDGVINVGCELFWVLVYLWVVWGGL